MSDHLPETPDLSRPYCPACEPEADPCREILSVRWCWDHPPDLRGADDPVGAVYVSSASDFDAETNRRVCALLAGREPSIPPGNAA